MKQSFRIANCYFAFLFFSTWSFAQQGEWTWMQGCNTPTCGPTWGTQGISDPANTPGGVYAPYYWVDAQKNLWLYGGISSGYYSAMWKFDPSINEWTWMSGNQTSFQSPIYGSLGVFNSTYTPGYRAYGSVCWTDNDGKFWLFGGDGSFGTLSDLWEYDPSINQWALMNGNPLSTASPNYGTKGIPAATNTPGGRREGNATWVDSLGNLWMFGGASNSSAFYNDIWEYDVTLGQWVWMAGSNLTNQSATYGTQGVADPLNVPSSRSAYCKWTDPNGKFWMFGGGNYNTGIYYADLWMYDPATNYWTWMSGSSSSTVSANAGSECDSSSAYYPASRFEDRSCASDDCGNFWLWGGIHTTNDDKSVNDMWVYRVIQNDWTYVNGALTYNQSGVYGTQGQSDPNNVPGSRLGSVMWFDSTGNLWMFGGSPSWYITYYNDVWKYVPDPTCPAIPNCGSLPIAAFNATDTTICEKFCINFTDQSVNDPVSWQWIFDGASPSTSTEQNPTNICYDDPGVYDVTLIAINSAGITDTLTLTDYITVYQNPFAPTITQTGNILTSSPSTVYQWLLNGDTIPGATDQSYTMTQSGLYTVLITNENSCNAQASIQAWLVGISEISDDFFVNVFANPSNGEIVLAGKIIGSDEVQIQLFNDLGQEVLETTRAISSDFRETIDVKNLASGIYFVKLTSGSLQANRKIFLSP